MTGEPAFAYRDVPGPGKSYPDSTIRKRSFKICRIVLLSKSENLLSSLQLIRYFAHFFIALEYLINKI